MTLYTQIKSLFRSKRDLMLLINSFLQESSKRKVYNGINNTIRLSNEQRFKF